MYLEPRHKKEQISGVECVNALISIAFKRQKYSSQLKLV